MFTFYIKWWVIIKYTRLVGILLSSSALTAWETAACAAGETAARWANSGYDVWNREEPVIILCDIMSFYSEIYQISWKSVQFSEFFPENWWNLSEKFTGKIRIKLHDRYILSRHVIHSISGVVLVIAKNLKIMPKTPWQIQLSQSIIYQDISR